MAEFQEIAQLLVDALRCGNLEDAESHLGALNRSTCDRDLQAAAASVLEARTLARVHSSQITQSLKALAREHLYTPECVPGTGTFQLDA